jgi:hypothetical protein
VVQDSKRSTCNEKAALGHVRARPVFVSFHQFRESGERADRGSHKTLTSILLNKAEPDNSVTCMMLHSKVQVAVTRILFIFR